MSNIVQVSPKIREILDPELILSNAKLNDVMIRFEKEIRRGLKKETHKCSEVKCFVTYVQDLPNGNGKVIICYGIKKYSSLLFQFYRTWKVSGIRFGRNKLSCFIDSS